MMDEDETLETITEKQRVILDEFRERVTDILQPHHDDNYLLRWLTARRYDIVKAEKMLRNHFEWREEWKVDDILEWEAPEVLVKYTPQAFLGFDSEGSPVTLIANGKCDVWGFFKSATVEDIIRFNIKNYEMMTKLLEEQCKKLGKSTVRQVIIMDLEGFSINVMLHKQVININTTMSQMIEANYPEQMKAAYIVNVPGVFSILYNMMKRFWDEKMERKVHIFGSDRVVWEAVLKNVIDPQLLPKFLGGERVDPDGNPRCLTLIPSGDVPKYYYLNNNINKDDLEEDMISVIVKRGSKLKLLQEISTTDSQLKYCFWTEDNDIAFGIKFSSLNDKQSREVIPTKRVQSQIELQKGLVPCKEVGTYTVIFDNSFSHFRSKQLYYSVNIEALTNF